MEEMVLRELIPIDWPLRAVDHGLAFAEFCALQDSGYVFESQQRDENGRGFLVMKKSKV